MKIFFPVLLLVSLTIRCDTSVVRNKRQEELLDEFSAPEPQLFEGDMAGISPDTVEDMIKQANAEGNIYNPGFQGSPTNSLFAHWPDGKVYYTISSSFNEAQVRVIQEAMNDYHNLTCITFIMRTNEPDFVRIKQGLGCYSEVGRRGGQQDLSLGQGCINKGTVIHELMHAVGFYHEQSRWDRDGYIDVQFQNVMERDKNNFLKYELDVLRDLHTPYDYNSVMHYGMYDFSRNGQATVMPKPNPNVPIGQRTGFSEIDLKEIRLLYQCSVPGPQADQSPTINLSQRGIRLMNPIRRLSTESPYECIQHCKDSSECFACSHNLNASLSARNCLILGQNYAAMYDPTFAWSAWNREEIELGLRLYNHYAQFASPSSIECKQACKNDVRCLAMTYDSIQVSANDGNCYLHQKGYSIQTDPTLQFSIWRKT